MPKTGPDTKHRLHKHSLVNEQMNLRMKLAQSLADVRAECHQATEAAILLGGPEGRLPKVLSAMGSGQRDQPQSVAMEWLWVNRIPLTELKGFLPQLSVLAKAICPVPWGSF